MSKIFFCEKNRDMILNRANKYYENSREVLREKSKLSIENYLKKKRI